MLQLISEEPGARTSMLALLLSRSPDEINTHLRELESRGIVSRVGLGWGATSPHPPH
jgi:DeoR/GlpR family transcriptional regulator of sugar metabolism